jgi:probable HAF family extracellular repeat protein
MKADAGHAMSFVATDLGTLGGSFSAAFDVNDQGLVVGRSSIGSAANVFHAFVWSEDTLLVDLRTLDDATQSTATAINNNGVIVGFGPSENGGPVHAFVRTRANVLRDLSTLGGSTSSPTAINARGDVVGFSDISGDSAFHAFLWTRQHGMLDLGTLGGPTSTANAISDEGVVVGESAKDEQFSHAFMWTRHAGMMDLGTLGGDTSVAESVDGGVIVGHSQTTQKASDGHTISHAFVWTSRTGMVDIGVDGVDSFGEKINGRFVIGHVTTNGTTHGFIWTQRGGFVDLGTLDGDTSSLVTGVNEQGVVTGNSFVSGEPGSHAFVWSASSGRLVPLDSPLGGSTEADAITGNFIVGSSCDAGVFNCHATLWKPAPHSRKDRNGDDD